MYNGTGRADADFTVDNQRSIWNHLHYIRYAYAHMSMSHIIAHHIRPP